MSHSNCERGADLRMPLLSFYAFMLSSLLFNSQAVWDFCVCHVDVFAAVLLKDGSARSATSSPCRAASKALEAGCTSGGNCRALATALCIFKLTSDGTQYHQMYSL